MTAIESWLQDILRCPSCRSTLAEGTGPEGSPELQCTGCSLAYRVDDGIPVLLVDEARTRS
ncbi:Trm112 family protein [Kineosporia rhizophila]|uniref:Trm112 family protein n=1 Tax=Kineosporia rhizophila TaxID=84633 RepID=UPI001E522F22|nr:MULTISPECIES: Trm112 family protein [Kineosporia]MCE0534873.1 Trm112 family protein [Kineosporia rhizophila]